MYLFNIVIFHRVCTATCNQGYQFDTGKKFENRVCDDSTGVWADGNVFPFCVSKYTYMNSNLFMHERTFIITEMVYAKYNEYSKTCVKRPL